MVCALVFHSLTILFCKFKLIDGESEPAFFIIIFLWRVHIFKLKLLHTESRAVHGKYPKQKDAISVVQVNKRLAAVS